MSGPLLPFIRIPEIPLGLPKPFDSIKPFGVLVATGVYLGSIVAIRHARQRNLDVGKMNNFILYVVGIGFVGAHLLDAIFYTPERIARDPIYLLQFWAGLSSYGGFIGAMTGALLFKYLKKQPVLPYVDTVCSAFPLAWVFGRAGCASVHDHPGRDTTSWLGVQWYNPRTKVDFGLIWDSNQALGKFDLGLIEMLLTIPLAVTFAILWVKRPRAYGFYAGWQCVLYAPIRFVLDFFRMLPTEGGKDADPRYLGLTPAQFACFGLLALGLYLLHLSRSHPAPASWAIARAEGEALAAAEEAKRAEEEGEEPEVAAPVARKVVARADPEERRRRRREADASEQAPRKTKKKKSALPGDGSSDA